MIKKFFIHTLLLTFMIATTFNISSYASNDAIPVAETEVLDLSIDSISYICGCQPDIPNPAGNGLLVYQGNYCGDEELFLINVNLSKMPSDREIVKAELKVYCKEVVLYGAETGSLVYEPIVDKWDREVTYHKRPKGNPAFRVVTHIPEKGQWHIVDITKIVKAWQSNQLINYGIICSSIVEKGKTLSVAFLTNQINEEKYSPKIVIYLKK